MDWREHRLIRAAGFQGRLTGSLVVKELKNLQSNWLACIRDTVIKPDSDTLADLRALEQALIFHGLQKGVVREEVSRESPVVTPQQKPTAPGQQQKFVPHPLPLQSA